MAQKITDKAILQCNQGTRVSPLAVNSQNFCFVEDKLAATEKDNQVGINIQAFGHCKLKPVSGGYLPCCPVPTSWQDTTEKDTINEYKILLNISTCPCAIGGTIGIKDKGYDANHEME